MKHAVVGAGGIGGLVAALLTRCGEQVAVIVREQSRAAQPGQITLDRPSEQIVSPVTIATRLDSAVDVLWIAVKATQLAAALESVSANPGLVQSVVPLLNGVDHVAFLRRIFGERVVPATIAVEAERIAPGHVVQRSPFVRVAVSQRGRSQLDDVSVKLRSLGVEWQFIADEMTLLWNKLCFLAPFALTTTAAGMTCGEIMAHPEWSARLRSAALEACAVAVAEGAAIDSAKIISLHASLPPSMRSSMQKDVAAGRTPELDAIAGPILRGAKRHHVSAATCQELNDEILGR
jgi:2-dehydropantoate 2-reductase